MNNAKKTYKFDITGKRLKVYPSATAAAKDIRVPRKTVYDAVKKSNLVLGFYYFSYSEFFKPPYLWFHGDPLKDFYNGDPDLEYLDHLIRDPNIHF